LFRGVASPLGGPIGCCNFGMPLGAEWYGLGWWADRGMEFVLGKHFGLIEG